MRLVAIKLEDLKRPGSKLHARPDPAFLRQFLEEPEEVLQDDGARIEQQDLDGRCREAKAQTAVRKLLGVHVRQFLHLAHQACLLSPRRIYEEADVPRVVAIDRDMSGDQDEGLVLHTCRALAGVGLNIDIARDLHGLSRIHALRFARSDDHPPQLLCNRLYQKHLGKARSILVPFLPSLPSLTSCFFCDRNSSSPPCSFCFFPRHLRPPSSLLLSFLPFTLFIICRWLSSSSPLHLYFSSLRSCPLLSSLYLIPSHHPYPFSKLSPLGVSLSFLPTSAHLLFSSSSSHIISFRLVFVSSSSLMIPSPSHFLGFCPLDRLLSRHGVAPQPTPPTS
eukprot:762421-Hanusia_phi.AAC.2